MRARTLVLGAALLVAGCGDDPAQPPAEQVREKAPAATERAVTYTEEREPCADYTPLRQPLFGDVHVHTSFSFDAAANTTGATPVDAHRYAQGEAIPFWPLDADGRPAGTARIDRPLDFLAVTDHGEFLGERRLCREAGSPRYDTDFCKAYRSGERHGMRMLGTVITAEEPVRIPEVCGDDGALCREYAKGPWQAIVEAAEAAYDRTAECRFTSFVGYEYTGTPGTSNFHRNVIFRNSNVPELPVSYIDAPSDTRLWRGLDAACRAEDGCDYLTIPHNSNLANGRMGPYTDIDPTPDNRRAYAETRLDREPIMEIFQHKGASECINGLSSVLGEPDELCDIEAVRVMDRAETYATAEVRDGRLVEGTATEVTAECAPGAIGANGMLGAGCVSRSDFIRSGLLVGLEEERAVGANPMKLGMIASTDTHTATPGNVSESDWGGHVTGEATPAERLQPGLLTSGIDGNPGGLAGVWAVENSRDAIFDAMERREVFGTSGPRILPRFFAGWGYGADLCAAPDMVARAYDGGVPMGGDLAAAPAGGKPVFVAYAARDPAESARPLQRLQLVKGWIDATGQNHTQVTTIAGSADGNPADGHDTLCAVHTDADFDAAEPAYYYLRVVEHPSPRWHTYDCERLAPGDRPDVCRDGSYPDTVHELAWTSPIWYRPATAGAGAGR